MIPREIGTFTSPQRKGPKEAPGLERRGCMRGPEWTDRGGCMARTPASVFHEKGGSGLGTATLRNVGVSAVRPGGIQGRGGLACV